MNRAILLKRIKQSASVIFICLLLSCAKEVSVSPEDLPVGTGFITVDSSPANAKIYLDGVNTGKVTPDSIRFLNKGDYKILLRLSGWKDTLLNVNLNDGEKKNFFVNFKLNPAMFGAILITSSPAGALITVDDSATGKVTPATIYNLLPGTHSVELKKAKCEDDEFEAEVKSQSITEINRVLADTSYWITYRTKNSGIPSNYIFSIAVDKENAKWIGTDGKGVAVLKNDEWTVYNSSNSPLQDNRVQCVFIDNQNNKWFGTTNDGLVKFDGTNWTIFNKSNSSIPSNNIMAIAQSLDGSIWVGTYDKGIAVLKGNVFTFFNTTSGLPSNFITSILVGKSNEIWVATYKGGAAVYKSGTWKVFNNDNSGLSNSINTLGMDNNGVIYAGTIGSGAARFVSSSWEYIQPSFAANIQTIAVDKKNYVWIGSNENGFSLIQGIFTYRDIYDETTSPIVVPSVYSIAVDKDNFKWIGTYGGGLVKFKGKQQ